MLLNMHGSDVGRMVRASNIHVRYKSYMQFNIDQKWAEELGLHTYSFSEVVHAFKYRGAWTEGLGFHAYTCTSYMLLNMDQRWAEG